MSTTPDPTEKQRVIAYYDQEAGRYIDLYRGERMEREVYPANDIRLEIIVERLRKLGARMVLDVGCGSGGPLARFLEEGYDALGIDFSEGMVSAASEVLSAAGHDPGRVAHGDVEREETLPAGPFDAVVATVRVPAQPRRRCGIFIDPRTSRAGRRRVRRVSQRAHVALLSESVQRAFLLA